jgi:hypothetical protein
VKRVLALLVAVALIALGFLVRDWRAAGEVALPGLPTGDGGEGGDDGGGGGGNAGDGPVLCDTGIVEVCDELAAAGVEVRHEAAGASVDRLVRLGNDATGEDLPTAWVTVAPWPAIVDEARQRAGAGPLFDPVEGPAVASSPLVLLIWEDRGQVLAAACESGEVDLDCVGQVAGSSWSDLGGQETWGALKPGFDDPTTSSIGLAALGAVTAAELDTLGFGTRSLSDGDYLDVLSRLGGSVPDFRPTGGSPLAAAVIQGPSSYDLLLTTEAAASAAVEGSAQWGPRLRATHAGTVEGDGVTVVDLIVASTGGDATDTRSAVGAAAAAAGWHVADGSPDPLPGAPRDTSELPSVQPGATLPSAGALTALRTTFSDTVRR